MAIAAANYVALDDDMVAGYDPTKRPANYGPTTPVADYFEHEKDHPGVQWLLTNGTVQVIKTSNEVGNYNVLLFPYYVYLMFTKNAYEYLVANNYSIPKATYHRQAREYTHYMLWLTAKGAADSYNYMRKFRYLPRETTGDTVHYMVLFRPTTNMMLSLLHSQRRTFSTGTTTTTAGAST